MRVMRLADGVPFTPVDHHGVQPIRLQGSDASPTEKFGVVISHYLPGAQAQLAPQPTETVYVVLTGELVMGAEGDEQVLAPYDSVHFTAGTLRTVENRSQLPATMLVIRATS